MEEVEALEAKKTLGALLDRVERGEEIVIMRHGRPVARLVPNSGGIDPLQAQAAAHRLRERGRKLKLGAFRSVDWKADRDDGRP